eukprot:scaffold19689_cov31-Tisochrysis_lutea.AAC.7
MIELVLVHSLTAHAAFAGSTIFPHEFYTPTPPALSRARHLATHHRLYGCSSARTGTRTSSMACIIRRLSDLDLTQRGVAICSHNTIASVNDVLVGTKGSAQGNHDYTCAALIHDCISTAPIHDPSRTLWNEDRVQHERRLRRQSAGP